MRERFPGLADGWARLDGPAGTQMVDVAIDAMAHHLRSGESANVGGEFAASRATGALVDATRETVGRLLGAPAEGIVFGANMTTLTFAFTRAVALGLVPGDAIVCTRLDHDANVTPWVLAAHARGARVVLVPFDPRTGRFEAGAIEAHTGPGTRWIAVTGASNALGTVPDLEPVVAAARTVGARVFVDAVHLVPHRPVDVRALGVDALVTSAYKWYGPHAGVLWVEPRLLASLRPEKVRPAPDSGPARFETGTAAFEALAGVRAAARFLLDSDPAAVAAAEQRVFTPLLRGLLAEPHVTVFGPRDLDARTPTVCFTVEGHAPSAVAARLAEARVAVWSGDYYAVEVMQSLGLDATGGAVRAGVSRYTTDEDVARLLTVVGELR
jgi:cysteine desulfurase family protein (TIGR01976 family)